MRIRYTVENTLTEIRDKGKETVCDIIGIPWGILYALDDAYPGGGSGNASYTGSRREMKYLPADQQTV